MNLCFHGDTNIRHQCLYGLVCDPFLIAFRPKICYNKNYQRHGCVYTPKPSLPDLFRQSTLDSPNKRRNGGKRKMRVRKFFVRHRAHKDHGEGTGYIY